MNIFSRLVQKIILSSIKYSPVTSIAPLSSIKSAVLLVDWNGADVYGTIRKAEEFFGSKGIRLTVLNPQKNDFTLLGRLKKRVRLPEGKNSVRNEDMFLSLATGNTFAEEFEAFSSPAIFKVGRSYFKPGIYDFLVQDRPDLSERQPDVLDTILDNLMKIER